MKISVEESLNFWHEPTNLHPSCYCEAADHMGLCAENSLSVYCLTTDNGWPECDPFGVFKNTVYECSMRIIACVKRGQRRGENLKMN